MNISSIVTIMRDLVFKVIADTLYNRDVIIKDDAVEERSR